MDNRFLTIIFSALAAMFTELNSLILSGCERDPDMDGIESTFNDTPAPTEPVQEAAAILSGAPATTLPAGGTVVAPPAPGTVLNTQGPAVPPANGVTVTGNVDPDVRVDVEGIPWDKRIHSSGKTFYKSKAANGAPKGAWKLKKGVDAVTVAQIKTELAGGYQAAPGAATTGAAGPTTAPGETVETCTDIYTWASLVEKATAKGVTPEHMAAACQKFSVPGIIELQDQPLLIPAVGKELGL